MPDDELFEDTPEEKPEGESEEKPSEKPQSSLSPDDIQTMLERELSPLADILRDFKDRLDSLEGGNKPEGGGEKPAVVGGEMDDAALKAFLEDPEGFVRDNYQKDAAKNLGPLFGAVAEDKINDFKGDIRASFDEEFGEGKFAELVEGDFDQVVSALPVSQRLSKQYLTTIVNGIKGMKFNELAQAREVASEDRKANPPDKAPTMLGSSRPRPAKGTLSEDERLLLTKLADAGVEVDPKAYMQSRDAIPSDYESYKKWKQSQKGGARA